jgi:VanZ family protein
VALMALIFGLSSMSKPPLPGGVSDHTAHFAAYALLSALLARALAGGRWAGMTWGRASRAWGISVLYGASDELHQGFVPGRFPSVDDVVADALGAAAAVAVLGAVAALVARRRAGRAV